MKPLALILCLLTGCTTAQRDRARKDARWFFRHNDVSFTVFGEVGDKRAGITFGTKPDDGKRVARTGK